jgi:cardiolipin synthase A/B
MSSRLWTYWKNRRQTRSAKMPSEYPAWGPVDLPEGGQIVLLPDEAALDRAREVIVGAERRIWLEIYIFSGDRVGREFAQLLMEKARQGVEVRVLYDAVGSGSTPPWVFAQMRRAGVEVRCFHPVWPWQRGFRGRWLERNHRKLLLVDDRVAGLGGMNISREYGRPWMWHRSRVWRDTAVGLSGEGVEDLRKSFLRSWSYVEAEEAQDGEKNRGNQKVSLISQEPGGEKVSTAELLKWIGSAQKELWVTMAYFAPPESMMQALKAAVARGVQVRMVLAGKSDIPVMKWAARSFYREMLDVGIEIYERKKTILHAKTFVVDGRWSVVGSLNWDARSLDFNFELSVVVDAPVLAEQMKEMFERDVKVSCRITDAHWRRVPWLDRFGQRMVRWFRRWL